MGQQWIMNVLSGESRGLGAGLLRTVLLLAEGPYRLVVRLRRWAYRCRLLPSGQAAAAVISVGNITTGGTGKTPMVAWVVRRLRELGRRPAVLMRGYKAVAGRSDEAEMLRIELGRPAGLIPLAARQALTAAIPADVAVFAKANRQAAAREAVSAGADVLVMDDGFQHLRLRRDLDIVLIDATCPFGFGHVLPRGLLRESLSALAWADAVVITRADGVGADELAALRRRLAALAPRASLHTAAHRVTRLSDQNGELHELSELAGKRVLAFCGLGNPQQFFDTVKALGAELAATHAFDDHAIYGPRELGQLERLAASHRAELFVTSQKDAVKLPPGWLSRPLWKLAVEMEIIDGRQELLARIGGVLNHPQR